MLNQCKNVGVDFQPLIFEAHGGAMSPTTRMFLDYISRTTTTVDQQSASTIALRIAQCLSISLQRDAAQA
eukprot:6466910-Amphidinium_carterae.1